MSLIWNAAASKYKADTEEKVIVPAKPLSRKEKRVVAKKDKAKQKLKANPLLQPKDLVINENVPIVGDYNMNPKHPDLEQALREAVWTDVEKELTAIQLDCTTKWGALAKGDTYRPWFKDPKTCITAEEKASNRRLTRAEILAPRRNFVTSEDGRTISLLPTTGYRDSTIIPGHILWSHVVDFYTRRAEKLPEDDPNKAQALIDAKIQDAKLATVFVNKQEGTKGNFDRQIKGVFPDEKKVEAY